MADEMDTPSAPSGGLLGGRQKRAFLVAAVLVLGIGLAIRLLGKQASASGTPADAGTADTSGVSAPPPATVYNYYTQPGDPSGGMPSGGTTSAGTGHTVTGGTVAGVIHYPVGVVRNPIDPLGSGPNGLIPHVVTSPGNPQTRTPVAPLPAGSDPAHYVISPGAPRVGAPMTPAAPVVSPAAPRPSILTPNFRRALLG